MTLEGPLDLATVDGRVARAQRSLEREHARLATSQKQAREEARARDPFAGVRDVAGQSMFTGLRALDPGPVHAPHRDALLRWVHELLQARVGWDLGLDEADAAHAPDPSLASRALAREHTGGGEPATVLVSFDQARRALIEAPTVAVAGTAFQRLVDLAAPMAAVRKELRARRFEAARRLGLDHPWALATGASTNDLDALARAVLDATEPLARELHKDLRRRTEVTAEGAAAAFVFDAFGRDAREGWPARLGTRWLEEVFRAIAPRAPRVLALPPALGGASFLRAASRWGAALRLGAVARSLPFALARDPYPVEAFVLGGALAVAVSDRVFAKRKLGLPARSADAHARALTRVLFVTLRTTAAMFVAGMRDSVRGDELEELTARVFGAPLPSDLAVAWSFGGFAGNARIDLPARLVAAVRTHGVVRDLVDRFDEDWFDNPRAGAHFASIGAGPVWQGEVPEPGAARAAARSFEEALG
ncbi:MAG: hypothetical protein BGO98_25135 [Myxococcales bacterium 68-20]|nr:MAG: hypothetical protein BGO98_25135 [Myxococcales bacterium 68-20]